MISKAVLRWLTLAALVGLSLGVMVPAASAAFVGTEITACSNTPITVAGNFFLKKNLTATGTDCIRVQHSNVAIDMNGHTITGDGTAGHEGITDHGVLVRAVAITNGKIKNFDNGIDFFGFFFGSTSNVITIEKVDSSDNKTDGIFLRGFGNNITDIKANRNGSRGIRVRECCNLFNNVGADDNKSDDGIRSEGCCSVFNKVTANRNGDDGIDARDCCNGISNSQANDNKNAGIRTTGDDNLMANVKTNGNTKDGIHGFDFDDEVTNANASNNGEDGIDLIRGDNGVADSVANNNKVVGIKLDSGNGNTVTDVTANHNATGVSLSCLAFDFGSAVNVRAHGNSVKDLSETGTCTNLLNKVGTGP